MRKKGLKNHVTDGRVNPVMVRLRSFINKLQRRFSRRLGRWMNSKSNARKKRILFLFCCCSLAICSYCVYSAFSGRVNRFQRTEAIRTSEFITQNGDESVVGNTSISDGEYFQMRQFLEFIDSLKLSRSGREYLDSLSRVRPGLVDSAKVIIELYQNNHK